MKIGHKVANIFQHDFSFQKTNLNFSLNQLFVCQTRDTYVFGIKIICPATKIAKFGPFLAEIV